MTTDTTPAAIAALMDGVTPGPWTPHRDPCHFDTLSDVRGGAKRDVKGISSQLMVSVGGFAEWKEQEANTRFIAAARDLVPALAAERDRLAAENERLRDAAQALGAMPEGYCFCSRNRIGDDSKTHEPECADLRAAIKGETK